MPPCHGGEGVRVPRSRQKVQHNALYNKKGCESSENESNSAVKCTLCCGIQMAKVGRPSICPERFRGSTPIRSTRFDMK